MRASPLRDCVFLISTSKIYIFFSNIVVAECFIFTSPYRFEYYHQPNLYCLHNRIRINPCVVCSVTSSGMHARALARSPCYVFNRVALLITLACTRNKEICIIKISAWKYTNTQYTY